MALRLLGLWLLAAWVSAMTGGPVMAQSQEPNPDAVGSDGLERSPIERSPIERSVLGAAAAFDAQVETATVRLKRGDRLLSGPRHDADLLVEVPDQAGPVEAAVVGERDNRSGRWLRVRWGDLIGWLSTGPAPREEQLLVDPTARRARRDQVRNRALAAADLAVEPLALDWAVEARAGDGSIRVWSDLARAERRRLRDLVRCLPGHYSERYGLTPELGTLEAELVVISDRDAYRRFTRETLAGPTENTGGFELDGLVVVTTSDFMIDLYGTIAHELTHALNRSSLRSLPSGLAGVPVWLEEGIAEDIAHGVEAALTAGRNPCDVPGGWARTRTREVVELIDGSATKVTYVDRTPRARNLLCFSLSGGDRLRWMDRLQFADAPDRPLLYVESMLLVRGLLAEGGLNSELLGDREPSLEHLYLLAQDILDGLGWRGEDRVRMEC